jgi:hypothetical protein
MQRLRRAFGILAETEAASLSAHLAARTQIFERASTSFAGAVMIHLILEGTRITRWYI